MCQNVPPLELFNDFRYNGLRPTFQNALVRIVVRLEQCEDGRVSDEWIRKNVLGPKRWAEFVALIIDWGWFARAENGNLIRAGLLAPQPVAEHVEEHHAATSDAVRMQIDRAARRQVDALARAMGLTLDLSETEQEPPKKRTGTEHTATNGRTGQTRKTNDRPIPVQPDSDSDSYPTPILSYSPKESLHINGESESDRIGYAAQSEHQNEQNGAQTEQPMHKTFNTLRKRGFGLDVIGEVQRRMLANNIDLRFYKYALETAKSVIEERNRKQQEAMTLLALENGGTPGTALEEQSRQAVETIRQMRQQIGGQHA